MGWGYKNFGHQWVQPREEDRKKPKSLGGRPQLRMRMTYETKPRLNRRKSENKGEGKGGREGIGRGAMRNSCFGENNLMERAQASFARRRTEKGGANWGTNHAKQNHVQLGTLEEVSHYYSNADLDLNSGPAVNLA